MTSGYVAFTNSIYVEERIVSVLGNILWILLGGFLLAILWFFAGFLCCVTIVGIPFGLQCFKIAGLVLAPFGKEISYGKMGFGRCLLGDIVLPGPKRGE